jgi:hypothetical protein
MILSQALLSELDSSGFCYDCLWTMHKICGKELSERGTHLAPTDYVAAYLVQNICFDTANHLDAIAPARAWIRMKRSNRRLSIL